ncbi:MAG TPA: HdeA/HdeB family chaperone [Phenylobacterium sp.]|nr:HdeA/HdeB family chaperone [Phenylobacterium sp.]
MKVLFVAAGMAALICSPAAAASRGNYTALGAGTQTCAAWVQFRQRDPSAANLVVSWVQGYLTASNDYLMQDGGVNSPDVTEIGAWLDGYCSTHPQSNIAYAAADLAAELLPHAK